MTRCLVTGISGFIGGALASSLLRRGHEVFGMGTGFRPPGLENLADYQRVRLPSPELKGLIASWDPGIVFHCAGSADPARSLRDPEADFRCGPPVVNELIESLRLAGGRAHLVLMSSAAVYGQPERLPVGEDAPLAPVSPYGEHKALCESLCVEACGRHGLRATAVRIFSAYGPGLRRQIVWDAIQKLSGEESCVFRGTGEETRDFVHIDDLVDALQRIGGSNESGFSVCNVASGIATPIRQVVAEVAKCLGRPDGSWGFEGGDVLGIPKNWRADISKLNGLGFTPTVELSRGISQTVEWARRERESLPATPSLNS